VLPISLENGLRLLRKTGIFQTLPLLHAHKLCAQTPKTSIYNVILRCNLTFLGFGTSEAWIVFSTGLEKELAQCDGERAYDMYHMGVHRLNERRYGVLLNSTLSFSGSSKGTVQLSI